MLDLRAFRAIAKEAVDARNAMRRTGETNSEELSTLVRVIAHMFGVDPKSAAWMSTCTDIRAILNRAVSRPYDWATIAAYVAPLTTGALLTLAPRAILPTTYTRNGESRIVRVSTGEEVQPSDHDWLIACGYVQVDTLDTVINGVAA